MQENGQVQNGSKKQKNNIKTMSIHDETWDKELRGRQHNTVPSVIMNERPQTVNLENISFDNIMSLAEAIDKAGGNPVLVLKDFRKMMNVLSSNNISIKAEYHGPRKP